MYRATVCLPSVHGLFVALGARKASAAQDVMQMLLNLLQVIIPAPYWVSYPEMARLAGAESVIVDTSDSGFVLTAEALRAALTPRSRMLILCTPSNPTGAVYDR